MTNTTITDTHIDNIDAINTVSILGFPIANLSMPELIAHITARIHSRSFTHIVTANAEILYRAHTDPHFGELLHSAELITPDGSGVLWAAKKYGTQLAERLTGVDLTARLAAEAAAKGWRIFLLGGAPGIAEEAARKLRADYPGCTISGTMNGYFAKNTESAIIKDINTSGTDILLVAMGAPRQEEWINRHRERLHCSIVVGVGGTLDVLAGKAKRAPEFMQKNGLEWLYRVLREPSRFKRTLALPRFTIAVLRDVQKTQK